MEEEKGDKREVRTEARKSRNKLRSEKCRRSCGHERLKGIKAWKGRQLAMARKGKNASSSEQRDKPWKTVKVLEDRREPGSG